MSELFKYATDGIHIFPIIEDGDADFATDYTPASGDAKIITDTLISTTLSAETVAYTGGGTRVMVRGDVITGATSSQTATVVGVVITGGTWAGGDAAGFLFVKSASGAFQSENLNTAGQSNNCTIGGDLDGTLQPVYLGNGLYAVGYTAAETTCEQGIIAVIDSATKAIEDQAIHFTTYGNASALHAQDLDQTLEAGADAALVTRKLDHLVAVAESDDPVNDSILAKMASTDGDWSNFVEGTDALQAIRDQGDSAWPTATGFSTHSAANVRTEMDSNSTQLASIVGDTNELQVKLVGITLLNEWLGAIAGKQNADATALTEIKATGAGSGSYDPNTDSTEALRDRGDAAWTTGGGGSILDILNLQPVLPTSIDLANTATVRLGLILTNALDDLPSTAEITPGTISIDRKAIGGTSWSSIVSDGAMSEQAGMVFFDEVFDSGTGYAEGDSIRVTFKAVKITVSANDFEICDLNGIIFQTEIRQTMRGTNSAALDSQITASGPTKAEMDSAHGLLATEAKQDIIDGNVDQVETGVDTLVAKFVGITLLNEWLGLIAGKQNGNATALTELKATGAGSGTYDPNADSIEALRDRGDSAWPTATGFNTTTPPTVAEIQAELEENGASLLDTIRDELANGTDGLSALLTAISAIPTDAMRGTDNAALASVLGALDDTAAAGDPTSSDTAMQYVKQLLNVLIGTDGVVTFPAAADPANAVSLAQVIRRIFDDTDPMRYTKTNELDVNTKSLNDAEVVGDGNSTPWDGA